MGPWAIGGSLSYLMQDEKNAAGQNPTQGTGAGHGNSSKDYGFGQVVGVNYVLGPGINLNSSVEHYEFTPAVTTTGVSSGLNFQNGQHAWIFSVGTALTF
jgi:hypothetical protein